MFKKTMTFDNLEGEEVTQTFYFNYSKKEIMELIELKDLEGMYKRLSIPIEESGLSQVENNRQAYAIFEDLILDAYGEKGEDNVTFVKNERTREYFKNHVAYVEMIFEFIANPDLVAEFMEKCLPPKMIAQAKEELAKESKGELKGATLAEMVAESEKRQKDPATRIEPGPEAAREALGPSPAVEKAAQDIAKENSTSLTFDYNNMTEDDINQMAEEEFKLLDPKQLKPELLQVAFRRKSSL